MDIEDIESLRAEAKRQGIKRPDLMKEETLRKKLGLDQPNQAQEAATSEESAVKIGSIGEGLLAHFNVKKQFIEQVRVANGLDRMEYSNLRKSFKCFKGDQMVGWMSMEDILVKGGAE